MTIKKKNELAENAIGIILAGSDDWAGNDTYVNFTGEYDWQGETCILAFFADGKNLGLWDIDESMIDDINELDSISAEVEAAYSGIDNVSGKKESVIGGTFIFKPDSQLLSELPDCKQYDGQKCKITGVDIEGPYGLKQLEYNYLSIEFEDGTEMSGISGVCLKKLSEVTEGVEKRIIKNGKETWQVLNQRGEYALINALQSDGRPRTDRFAVVWKLDKDGTWGQGHYFTDINAAIKCFDAKVESKKPCNESASNFDVISETKSIPEPGKCWIRVRFEDSYNPMYYEFPNTKDAELYYKEVVSGDEVIDGISDIALGFTTVDGKEEIRWQDYVDNFTSTMLKNKKESRITEDKEITADPTESLKKLGYKQVENMSGSIVYHSDVIYTPDIEIFGNIVEIVPLDNLPLTMTVEDHGKMIARLAQVQKAVEDLR